MNFKVGQKVSYPNHGVCLIENIESKNINETLTEFYALRVLANNSAIFVPKANAQAIGVRPVIDDAQCELLLEILAENFDDFADDWKIRIREFNTKLQTGCVFEAADVLKKLTFLTRLKLLSFREQKLLEKTKFLVVSELAIVCSETEVEIEGRVDRLLACACEKHHLDLTEIVSTVVH